MNMTVVMVMGCSEDTMFVRTVVGPFNSDEAAREWAENNVDHRTVWTMEDVMAPWGIV